MAADSYVVMGDLLESDADAILQQCNCVTSHAKGLSASIAKKFPHADFYSGRTAPSVPGTIQLAEGSRPVIALYAQYYPGKSRWENDTAEKRLAWFCQCLNQVGEVTIGGSPLKKCSHPRKYRLWPCRG